MIWLFLHFSGLISIIVSLSRNWINIIIAQIFTRHLPSTRYCSRSSIKNSKQKITLGPVFLEQTFCLSLQYARPKTCVRVTERPADANCCHHDPRTFACFRSCTEDSDWKLLWEEVVSLTFFIYFCSSSLIKSPPFGWAWMAIQENTGHRILALGMCDMINVWSNVVFQLCF